MKQSTVRYHNGTPSPINDGLAELRMVFTRPTAPQSPPPKSEGRLRPEISRSTFKRHYSTIGRSLRQLPIELGSVSFSSERLWTPYPVEGNIVTLYRENLKSALECELRATFSENSAQFLLYRHQGIPDLYYREVSCVLGTETSGYTLLQVRGGNRGTRSSHRNMMQECLGIARTQWPSVSGVIVYVVPEGTEDEATVSLADLKGELKKPHPPKGTEQFLIKEAEVSRLVVNLGIMTELEVAASCKLAALHNAHSRKFLGGNSDSSASKSNKSVKVA